MQNATERNNVRVRHRHTNLQGMVKQALRTVLVPCARLHPSLHLAASPKKMLFVGCVTLADIF